MRSGLSLVAADRDDTTNSDLVERNLENAARRGLRPATMDARLGVLNRLIEFFAPAALLTPTAADLDRWQRSIQHLSPSSIVTYTNHVRAFYMWAFQEQLIAADPSTRLPRPKLRRRLPRPIDEADLLIALDAARAVPRMFCWLLLAGYCGLRAGEISRLKGGDVKPSTADAGAWLKVDGKGGYERVVRIAPEVLEHLKPFLLEAGKQGVLFPAIDGRAFTPHDVSKYANRFLHQTCGLTDTFHSLRHRFGTSLADIGADIRDVQVALGHASLSTTSLYLAANTRRGAGSVDALASSLGGQ